MCLPLPPSTLPQAHRLHRVLGGQAAAGPLWPRVSGWGPGVGRAAVLPGGSADGSARAEPRPAVEGLRAQVPCHVSCVPCLQSQQQTFSCWKREPRFFQGLLEQVWPTRGHVLSLTWAVCMNGLTPVCPSCSPALGLCRADRQVGPGAVASSADRRTESLTPGLSPRVAEPDLWHLGGEGGLEALHARRGRRV